jgi:hypothetical protein
MMLKGVRNGRMKGVGIEGIREAGWFRGGSAREGEKEERSRQKRRRSSIHVD